MHYTDHRSIKALKRDFNRWKNELFSFSRAEKEEINKWLRSLNPKKDLIYSANISDSYLTDIINRDLTNFYFSKKARVAKMRPTHKKNSREDRKVHGCISRSNHQR